MKSFHWTVSPLAAPLVKKSREEDTEKNIIH